MSDMSLKMALSLLDTATPGLTTFMSLVETLGPKVTGLANRLSNLEKKISSVGIVSAESTPNLDKFGSSVGKVQSTTASLEGTLSALPGVLNSMVTSLQAAERVLLGATGTMNALSGASKNASGNINGATTSLSGMGDVVSNVTQKVHGLHGIMEGVAAQWAASKIFRGGVEMIDEAAEMEQVRIKVQALNFPIEQNAQINSDAATTADRLKISVREGLEAYMSAIAGLAVTDYADSKKVIQATLDEAIKTAILLRLRGDTSSLRDITRNLYGIIEARGQVTDPAAAQRTIEIIQQNSVATGGKLSTKDLETIFRQLKNGLGTTISDEGMIRVFALANQMKASGSGGGGGGMGVSQAGTAVTQVAKWGVGGVVNKETISALEAMGYIKPNSDRRDSSTTSTNIAPGAIKNSSLAVSDPLLFLQQMAPYALAMAMKNKDLFFDGKDTSDPQAIQEAMSKVALMLFKNVNQANAAVQMWNPGSRHRIEQEVQLTKQSKGNDEALKDVDGSYLRNVEKFDAAVKTLSVTIGTGLLPLLTPVVEGLTAIVSGINGFATAHPAAATLTAIAVAVGGLGLALFSLQKMFGVFTMISGLAKFFIGVGPAAAGAATGIAGIGTAAAGTMGGISLLLKGLGRGLGVVGLLILLYDTLSFFADFKIWNGVTGGAYFAARVDGVLSDLARLTSGFQYLFGWITKAENAQNQKRIDAEQKMGRMSSGIYDDPADDPNSKRVSKGIIGKVKPQPIYEPGRKSAAELKNETFEQHEMEKMIEEAKKIEAKFLESTRGKQGYNSGAGQANQEFKVEEAALAGDLRVLDAQRKASIIGDEEFYERKMEIINVRYNQMISDLNNKLAKLTPKQQGERDSTEASIEIKTKQKEDALAIIEADREKATAEYKQSMSRVQSILDDAEGKKKESRLEQLKRELDLLRQKAVLEKKPDDVAMIDKAIGATDNGISYEQVYRKYEAINNRVIQQQEIIDAKVKAGLMTETEAASQKWDLRVKEAEQLKGIIAQLEVLATASGDEKLVQKIALLKIQMDGAAQALSPGAEKMKNILSSSFDGFFQNVTSGNKTLKQSFNDLFSSINSSIMSTISKNLSDQLMKSIFGGSGSGASGGGGSWLTSIFGSLMGGGGGGAASAGGGSWLSSIGSWFSGLFSFDVGTNAVPFDMLAQIHKDEIIVPAADRDEAMARLQGGGGGGMTVQNSFYLSGATEQRTQNQIAARVAQTIRQAERNM